MHGNMVRFGVRKVTRTADLIKYMDYFSDELQQLILCTQIQLFLFLTQQLHTNVIFVPTLSE